jgi:preprotein translocase subunit SecA
MERAQKKVEGRNFDIRKTLIKFDDVMNDQRQVIFGQRLNILKSSNISEILQSFLEETSVELEHIKNNYLKSNDKQIYLTSVKKITGNIFDDSELINLTKLNKNDFLKKIEDTYKSKNDARVKLIGEKENNEIEKKIFLQIIDFAWRSHLQYLEELRQVIGLRSYGQKDPLSEFKKEAFVLFEGLLERIKTDIIKFLLNININISETDNEQDIKEEQNSQEQKVGRNEKCPCGSGKKFKHCHGNI